MSEPTPKNRTIVIVLASASFAFLGGSMTLAGALLPLLLEDMKMTLSEAGSLMAFQPIGFLLSVWSAGRLVETQGLSRVLTAGMVGAGLGYGGFALTHSWASGAAAMSIAGLGLGLAEVAVNAAVLAVVTQQSTRVLNFVHLFFGVGSFLTPLFATQVVASGATWRVPFLALAVLTAIVGVSWGMIRFPNVKEAESDRTLDSTSNRAIWLLTLMMGLYVGTELGIGNWLSKYLVAEHGATLTDAGTALSLYWLGVAAGRLVLSLMPSRTSAQADEELLILLGSIATAGLVLGVVSADYRASIVGFVVTGIGFSGIFPGIVSIGGRCQPDAVATAMTRIITGAATGNILIPWVMSVVGEEVRLSVAMAIYASSCALLLCFAILLRSLPRRAGFPARGV